MPEINDATLQAYQNAVKLLDTLYTDAELGPQLKGMIKKKLPRVSIPEIDAAKAVEPQIKSLTDAVEEIKGLFKKAKTEWDMTEESRKVKDEFSFTDEGMDRVRKRAEEEKIPLRAAAALLVHETPEPVQPSGLSTRWNMFTGSGDKDKDADLQQLVKDPEGWMENVIEKTWNPGQRRLPVGV